MILHIKKFGLFFRSYNSIYNKRIPKDKYTRINYDEYFMGIAYISSKRSKSVVKKIGACLVNKNKVIVGIGYNGLTRGLDTIPTNCVNEEVPASYFEGTNNKISKKGSLFILYLLIFKYISKSNKK